VGRVGTEGKWDARRFSACKSDRNVATGRCLRTSSCPVGIPYIYHTISTIPYSYMASRNSLPCHNAALVGLLDGCRLGKQRIGRGYAKRAPPSSATYCSRVARSSLRSRTVFPSLQATHPPSYFSPHTPSIRAHTHTHTHTHTHPNTYRASLVH
jgi:hypothetical protein